MYGVAIGIVIASLLKRFFLAIKLLLWLLNLLAILTNILKCSTFHIGWFKSIRIPNQAIVSCHSHQLHHY